MGKLRLKLAHVIPHAWYYKLKEIGKTGSYSYKRTSPTKVAAQQKLLAARKYAGSPAHRFPDSPKKSPVTGREESPINEEREGHDHALCNNNIADDPPASLKTHHSHLPHMPPLLPSSSQTPQEKGFHLNVQELDSRLKALSSQERRIYYCSSPIFSVALPSPILDGASPLDDLNLDLQDLSLNHPFEDHNRRFASKMIYEDIKPINEAGRSSNDSTSFTWQSTSSDRASSSVWERDLSSLTSEGSEHFTTIEEIDIITSMLQRKTDTPSMQKKAKTKVLHPIKVTQSPFYCTNDGISCSNGMCLCKGNERVQKNLSRCKSEINLGLRANPLQTQWAQEPIENMQKHEEYCSPPLEQNEGDDFKGNRRVSSNEFLHSERKDMLLCGRLSFDRCSESALSDSELETVSPNFRRLKLQQRGKFVHAISKKIFSEQSCAHEARIDVYPEDNPSKRSLDASPVFKDVYPEDNPSKRSLDANPSYLSHSKSLSRWPLDANPCDYHSNPPLSKSSSCRRSTDGDYHGNERVIKYSPCDDDSKSSISKSFSRSPLVDANPCDYHSNPPLSKSSSCRRSTDGDYHGNERVMKQSPCDDDSKSSLSKRSRRRALDDNQCDYQGKSKGIKENRCCCGKGRRGGGGGGGGGGSKGGEDDDNGKEGASWYKGALRVVRERAHEKAYCNASSKVYDSFAMVKCSYDPGQDFKESMMEMILQKELHNSLDLVELLQCFLTLNSELYHDTIVQAFIEVWSQLFRSSH